MSNVRAQQPKCSVKAIASTGRVLAALCNDGVVIVAGKYALNPPALDQLRLCRATTLSAIEAAYAALCADGSVLSWDADNGEDNGAKRGALV